MPTEEVEALLAAAYRAEVTARGGKTQDWQTLNRRVQQMAKWLTASPKPGLLLYGGIGNGKTTLARAVCRTISEVLTSASDLLANEVWNSTAEELRHAEQLRRSLREPVLVSAFDIVGTIGTDSFYKVKLTPFLILDDMGCEAATAKNYGTEVTPVAEIICERYDRMLPTIITSNLDDDGILRRYGSRVADRMGELFDRIAFDNASYR